MNKNYNLKNIDFYFITDSTLTRKTIFDDVEAALRAGVKIVQYREKNKTADIMVEEAKRIKDLCENKAIFIVNDSIDLALAVDADGVHLGQDDDSYQIARQRLGSKKIIGISASNVEQAIEAYYAGADYLGVGPIFATKTKKDAVPPIGLEMLSLIKEKTITLPIVAIGGITLENLAYVIQAGADSAAAISSVLAADDVEQTTRKSIKIIKKYQK